MENCEITLKGIEFKVDYEYFPAEKATYEYPGCHEHFNIVNLEHKGTDFSIFIEYFEDEIIEKICESNVQ